MNLKYPKEENYFLIILILLIKLKVIRRRLLRVIVKNFKSLLKFLKLKNVYLSAVQLVLGATEEKKFLRIRDKERKSAIKIFVINAKKQVN